MQLQKVVYYHVYYIIWLMLVALERLAFQEMKADKNREISYSIIGRNRYYMAHLFFR